MWVFTNQGFYSVVEDVGDETRFVVRARAKDDLDALREFIPDLKIVILKNRDYEYRAFVDRKVWERAMVALTRRIDYSNFKDSVTARQGRTRHDIYLRIWGVALTIARRERRAETLHDWRDDTLPWDDDLPAAPQPTRPQPDYSLRSHGRGRRTAAKKAK